MSCSENEFREKYGYWIGDRIVHHSYIHGKATNKEIADDILKIETIDVRNDLVKVFDNRNYYRKTKKYYPANIFEKLPDFHIGDVVIIHKPINKDIFTTWPNFGAMERFNETIQTISYIPEFMDIVLCEDVKFSFNKAWLEIYKPDEIKLDMSVDDFL